MGDFGAQMTDLAGSIRTKSGATGGLTISTMKTAVDSITTGGGGSAAVALAYVISHTPQKTILNSFTISGLENDSEVTGSLDVEQYNGVWTKINSPSDPLECIYKHATLNSYISFFDFWSEDDPTYPHHGWTISTKQRIDTGDDIILYFNNLEAIPSGDTSMTIGDDGGSAVSCTVVHGTTSAVAASTNAGYISTYTPDTDVYTVGSVVGSTATQFTPEVNSVYGFVTPGTGRTASIIGKPIGNIYGNRCILYWSGRTAPSRRKDYPIKWWSPSVTGGDMIFRRDDRYPQLVTLGKVQRFDLTGEVRRVELTMPSDNRGGTFKRLPASNNITASVAFYCVSSLTKATKLVLIGRSLNDACLCIYLNRTDKSINAWTPDSGSYVTYQSSSSLTSGWHHAAVSYDSVSHDVKLYLDGILVGTQTKTLNISKSTSVDEGCYMECFSGSDDIYDNELVGGYQCELKVWNTVLTQSQITAEYNKVSALWS